MLVAQSGCTAADSVVSVAQLTPSDARAYWRALLDNASQLVADARLLWDAGSYGRARSLTVLAEEELGKATGVYASFSQRWSDRSDEPADLATGSARDHLAKYRAAYEFGRELEMFWGDDYPDVPEDDDWERWHTEQRAQGHAAAEQANKEKQRGFYVDLCGGVVSTPAQFDDAGVAEPLIRAAQVIEMMLIRDHSRMKYDTPDAYDSTDELQWRVLPTSHPEEYKAFIASVERRRVGSAGDPPSVADPGVGADGGTS